MVQLHGNTKGRDRHVAAPGGSTTQSAIRSRSVRAAAAIPMGSASFIVLSTPFAVPLAAANYSYLYKSDGHEDVVGPRWKNHSLLLHPPTESTNHHAMPSRTVRRLRPVQNPEEEIVIAILATRPAAPRVLWQVAAVIPNKPLCTTTHNEPRRTRRRHETGTSTIRFWETTVGWSVATYYR
jgi:hypothetical protein